MKLPSFVQEKPIHRRFQFGLLVGFVFWVIVFCWLGSPSEPFWSGYRVNDKTPEYYSLLVDGFLSGHTSLAQPVDPDLLSRDPDVRSRAPYLLDATLFRGKYYLYYGVTPAVVLLCPYRLLTGANLGPECASFVFIISGFAASCAWLWCFYRASGRDWSFYAALLAVSVLAAMPGTTFLVRRSMFYELPIAAGYAFASMFWYSLWRVERDEKRIGWVILASLLFGLAVGCRANLIFMGLAFSICCLFRWRRVGLDFRSVCAGLLPASAIGLCLACYNWARFGNPLDFGFKYGLNPFFTSGNPFTSTHFICPNLRWYFLTPPTFAPWFPFEFPIAGVSAPPQYSNTENMAGLFVVTLLVLWVSVWRVSRGFSFRTPRLSWALALGAVVIFEVAFMMVLGVRAQRYSTDFLTPLAFLIVSVLLPLWTSTGRGALLVRAGCLVLVGSCCIHNILGAVQQFDQFRDQRPKEFLRWARLLNPSYAVLHRMGAPSAGGLEMQVRFHQPQSAQIVPLLRTGLAYHFDEVRAVVHPGGYLQLSVFHSGYGGPDTQLIPIEWGHTYDLQLSIGSLYPAASDSYFASEPPARAKRLKSTALILFDGKPVLKRHMAFYESAPWVRIVTSGDKLGSPCVSIDSATRSRVIADLINGDSESVSSVYDLSIKLPPTRGARPLPLIASGVTGKGSLLYFDPLPDGRYRLMVDEWGYGAIAGGPFSVQDGKTLSIEVVVGPALPFDGLEHVEFDKAVFNQLHDRILVWCDGKLVANFRLLHNLETFDQILLGSNSAGFSSAEPAFAGELEKREVNQEKFAEMVRRSLKTPEP